MNYFQQQQLIINRIMSKNIQVKGQSSSQNTNAAPFPTVIPGQQIKIKESQQPQEKKQIQIIPKIPISEPQSQQVKQIQKIRNDESQKIQNKIQIQIQSNEADTDRFQPPQDQQFISQNQQQQKKNESEKKIAKVQIIKDQKKIMPNPTQNQNKQQSEQSDHNLVPPAKIVKVEQKTKEQNQNQKNKIKVKNSEADEQISKQLEIDQKTKKIDQTNLLQLQQSQQLTKINILDYLPLLDNQKLIQIKDFIFTLTEEDQQQKQEYLIGWIKDQKSTEKFLKLMPFYFNILKRGETWNSFKNQLQSTFRNIKDIKQQAIINFNAKQLFNLIYLISDDELKLMLLKLQLKNYPVPFFYNKYAIFQQNQQPQHLRFNFNDQLTQIFTKCFPIFSFSLGKARNQKIGKTQLINQIFYREQKFSENDLCPNNEETIDIMFDQPFGNSRNFCVAETKGEIEDINLSFVGQFFPLWIIQITNETNLEEIISKIEQLRQNKINQKNIIIILRDANGQQINSALFNQYEFILLNNLQNLDEIKYEIEILDVQKMIFQKIKNLYDSNQKTQIDFITHFKNFIQHPNLSIERLNKIFDTLNQGTIEQDGFYSSELFPMRSIDYQISQLNKKVQKLLKNVCEESNLDEKYENLDKQIKLLEEKKQKQKYSNLIYQFFSLFQADDNYFIYLHFVERLRAFNQKNCTKISEEYEAENKELKQLKKQQSMANDGDQDTLIQQIDQKIKLLKEKDDQLQKLQIGIEIFWREIIEFQKIGIKHYELDPFEIIGKMIEKGEPFEFLDGDNLQISLLFLEKLISIIGGDKKVLVLTVLGPQSSGKSTLLNKIFGCSFWTSVGRCTKGIYGQLLKIQDKTLVQDLYDYLLILDSEGLQNPNQVDQEFDKKIALFTLSISDIILINIRGDIHQQFKNLVEICVYSLNNLRNDFSQIKQINWCFNQNADTTKLNVFLEQIQDMSRNQLLKENEFDDDLFKATDILKVSEENVKVLSFATAEIAWPVDEEKGIWEEWSQNVQFDGFSENAYQFGIQMIKNLIQKKMSSNIRNKDVYTISKFFEVAYTNWNTISRTPDLLEYYDLQHVQDDNFINDTMDENIEQNLRDLTRYIINNFDNQLQNIETFDRLQELAKDTGNQIDTISVRYQNNLQSQLQAKLNSGRNTIKNKKVIQKIENKIKTKLEIQKLYLQLTINNQIFEKQIEVAQLKSIPKIEELITNISSQNQQSALAVIKKQFQDIWQKILEEQQKKLNLTEVFQKLSFFLFTFYEKELQNFIIKTNNNKLYQQMVQQIEIENFQQSLDVFLEAFMKDIKNQSNFMLLRTSHSLNWLNQIFSLKIEQKCLDLKSQKSQLFVSLEKLFYLKQKISRIEKSEFIKFLSSEMPNNFIQNVLKQVDLHNENDVKNKILEYFWFFEFFGLKIRNEKVDELFNTIDKQMLYSFSNLDEKIKEYFQSQLSNLFEQCEKIHLNQKIKSVVTDQIENVFHLLITKVNSQNFYLINNQNSSSIVKQKLQSSQINLSSSLQMKQQQSKNLFSSKEALWQYLTDFNININYRAKKIETNKIEEKVVQEYLMGNQQIEIHNQYQSIVIQYISNNFNWRQLFQIIYEKVARLIKEKFSFSSDIQDFSSYNSQLINNEVMFEVQIIINQVNRQLANLGVILNQMGETNLKYFTLLISWRILNHYYQENIQQTKKKFEDFGLQAEKRFFQLANNPNSKSNQDNANNFALAIETFLLKNLEDKFRAKLKSQIQQLQPNYEALKVLEKIDLNIFNNQTDREQVYQYIRNPIQVIENYLKTSIDSDFKKIIDDNKIEHDKQMTQTQKQILENLNNLLQLFDIQNRSIVYYEITDLQQQENICPYLTFLIFCESLQSSQNITKNITSHQNQQGVNLKSDYQNRFTRRNKHQIDLKEAIYSLQAKNEIFDLKLYIQTMIQFFQKKYNPIIVQDYAQLDIQQDYDDYLQIGLGCKNVCPACNRKCDQSGQNHQHACQKGHYIKGMNGISCSLVLSQQVCEETGNDQIFKQFDDPNISMNWQQIIAKYQQWNFQKVNQPAELQSNKNKWQTFLNQNQFGTFLATKITGDLQLQQQLTYRQLTEQEMAGVDQIFTAWNQFQ